MTERSWAFITSHGAVLIEVARASDSTVRELAERAGLTERQTHRVLADLCDGGYLVRERVGLRNQYRVNDGQPMRHPTVAGHQIGELLEALGPEATRKDAGRHGLEAR